MQAAESSAASIPPGLPEDATASFRREPAIAAHNGGAPPPALAGWLRASESEGAGLELKQKLARGGQGEVWEGRQASLARTVAVKRPRRDGDPSQEATRDFLFLQEALTASRLEHPNIVPVYELACEDSGRPMLAMKLVRGSEWRQVIRDEFDALPAAEFLARHVAILVQVCHAVAFAHSRGIVHRDIKPSQVMLGEFGEVLLMDWGQALAVNEAPLEDLGLPPGALPDCGTAPNPSGTAAYMAPEQTTDASTGIGFHTDVYLLGGTLWELLTGKPPHAAPLAPLAFYRASTGHVPDLAADAPQGRPIPEELAQLALDCLQPESTERPRNVEHVRRELESYLSGARRRAEAEALLESAESMLDRRPAGYDSVQEAERLVGRAIDLWPSTPGARELRARAALRHAELAFANRDLRLARLMLEQAGESGEQQALRAKLAAAERREAVHAYQRCWFIRISITLATVFFFALLHYYWKSVHATERIELLSEALWESRARHPDLAPVVSPLLDAGAEESPP